MREMSRVDMDRLLGRSRLGHLGLAREGRAYVIPVFYAYDGRAFFFQTLPGLKDEFLQGTTEACFVVTDAPSDDTWASVQAVGRLSEVRDVPDQLRAMEAMLIAPFPPVQGETEHGEPRRSQLGLRYLKLTPTRMAGRFSEPAQPREAEPGLAGM
jgi:nitroimidazol reductase NimA-like FMN-containing flavoprotein (pyridoxamine 5'-phosphate oxidase superfamily)